MGYIYKITNTVTGKCYIGESKEKNVERRWKEHIRLINQNKGCPALRDAVKKHGWDKFKFEVIIICFDEDRYFYEKDYIKKFNSKVPNGYNITDGGEGGGFIGKTHNEEVRKRLSEASKKFYSNPENRKAASERAKEALKGINISERMKNSEKWKKAVEKMIVDRKGKTPSEETKQKIRESVIKYYSKNEDKVKINVEKQRKAMSEKLGKKVSQYTKEGEFINTYKSIKEASRQVAIHNECIRRVANGNGKLAGGFIWKLCEEKINV